ncbi:MAG: hypothetical protein COT28_05550 [Methylobacterium sp. CG08_land_8_20_14_0_20_71_15]|nr:MAG: hypothetical protein COT56_21140 [Methylobacterium sp. CG09_land_8_20_14_0_10_71_15]PIU15191.1 MAG: hypothetical protein COT28_05550 [Methylobacterium sp. CG08_land_8_20_14_0_20_71_15]
MRLVRLLGLCAVVGLSTGVIALVSADRLAHPPRAPAQAAAPVRPVPAEPSATGSIPLPPKAAPAKPVAAKPAIPNGFDTERLHALMRGDPILPGRR